VSVLQVLQVRRVLKVLVLAVPRMLTVLVLMVPGGAAAQDAKGYVEGIVGLARTVESDTVYAGLAAWRLNDRLHLFGEVGRMRNAIGQDLADRLAAIKDEIEADNRRSFGTEFSVVFEPLVPAWYGFGGVRVRGPSRGQFSSYLEGGAGSARLDPQVHLTINGENLDNEAAAITGLGDGRQQLAFLAGGGAGLAVQVWKRIRVEGGYRYMRLFGDAKTNINRAHVAAGWTF
jgi:opacity protein-like surface antigen